MTKVNHSLREAEPEYCARLDSLPPTKGNPLFPETEEFKSAWDCLDPAKDNPFYSNHVFNQKDLARKSLKITWSERVALFFLPMYVSIGIDCDYIFYYKRWAGRIYLIKEESRDEIIAEGW